MQMGDGLVMTPHQTRARFVRRTGSVRSGHISVTGESAGKRNSIARRTDLRDLG